MKDYNHPHWQHQPDTASWPYRYATSSSYGTPQRPSRLDTGSCTCKKSRCLKLYCHCFAQSSTCGPHCRCTDCANQHVQAPLVLQARRSILARNPQAFQTAKGSQSSKCRCQKSFCLKKYCDCFAQGNTCQVTCRCVDCHNTPAHKQLPAATLVSMVSGKWKRSTRSLEAISSRSTAPLQASRSSSLESASMEASSSPMQPRKLHEPKKDGMALLAAAAFQQQEGESRNPSPVDANKHHTERSSPIESRASPVEPRASPTEPRSSPTEYKRLYPNEPRSSPITHAMMIPQRSPTAQTSRIPPPMIPPRASPSQSSPSVYPSPYLVRPSPPMQPVLHRNMSTSSSHIPYRRSPPPPPPPQPSLHLQPEVLPKALSFRKICSRCGHARDVHGDSGFGHQCRMNKCARCRRKSHIHMGLACTKASLQAAHEYRQFLLDLQQRAVWQREYSR